MAGTIDTPLLLGTGPRLRILILVVFAALLPLTALHDYLLFHVLSEVVFAVVALSVLIMAWTLRPFLADDFPVLLGQALGSVVLLHLMHMLDYPGMDVLTASYDQPTQVWLAARFILAASAVIAPFALGRRLPVRAIGLVYLAVAAVALMAVYWWQVVPSALQRESGLTEFKRVSEYVICALFALAMVLLWRRRAAMPADVLRLLEAALATSIAAELFFTLYQGPQTWPNLVGHVCLVLSALLIYMGMIEDGLTRPHAALVASLRDAERLHARLESSLLPRRPVSRGDVTVTMYYRPSETKLELGGDFLDVLDLGPEGLAVICGDVSGHGPDPAALGAVLRVSWQALVRSGVDAASLVGSLRGVVERERRNPETFVTLCLAWIDPRRDRMWLLNVGHPAPLLMAGCPDAAGQDAGGGLGAAAGPMDAVAAGCPPGHVREIVTVPLVPLGTLDVPVPEPEFVDLPPGWQLFFYTDGLVETRMVSGATERFGEERLRAMLEAECGTPLGEETLARLLERIESAGGEPFADDVTVVVVGKRESLT